MYIQVNEKAPLEQQIKQLKTQLEIILDNLELGATATVDSLPEGGTDGQVLTKQTDGSADWEDPAGGVASNGLPSGGTADQILAKNSNDNYDGKWVNPYAHPASHSPSIILEDENNRFVTDAEIAGWNAKQAALGFTPEDSANKKTSLAENSDTYYPTQKAVKTAVDGKSDTGHGHAISDVTDLSTALSGKAASSHGHAIGDVTDLSTTLAGKADAAKGVPTGGTTDQVLAKASNTDNDLKWVTPSGGSSLTEYTDTFTTDPMTSRVAARTGGTWTHDSANGKLQVVAPSSGVPIAAQIDAPMCSALGKVEIQVELTITTDTAARKHAGLFIETSGTGGTGYRIVGLDNTITVTKYTNAGSSQVLCTVATSGFTTGTTYTLKVIADFYYGRIFVYLDNVFVTAASMVSGDVQGRPGYFAYGNTVKFDNLSYKYS